MKRIVHLNLLFAFLFLAACNDQDKQPEPDVAETISAVPKPETSPANPRMQNAVMQLAIADLKTGGFNIEYLQVDSLTYKTASWNDYYLHRKEELEKSREAYRNVTRRLIESGTPVNMVKYRDDSVKSDKAAARLQTLIAKADTLPVLYKVQYHLNAKTNTTPYNMNYTKFLFINDLKEVRLQFGDQ